MNIDTILLIAAAICFVLAALNFKPSMQWLPLGLLLWVLTALIP